MGRLVFFLGVVFALACATMFAWIALDLPPPALVLRHGFPPAGGPTGKTLTIEGVTFVELGPGYFRMGSRFGCEKGDLLGRMCRVFHLPWEKQPKETGRELPVHWVSFRRPYWIATTEVTNRQYERFDPQHERSQFSKGDRDPVVDVSWAEARRYCSWLSRCGGLAVRLPSESEWEAACRAGSRTEYCFGDDEAGLGEHGWYKRCESTVNRAYEVKTRRPNAWGLYDLHGNVWEWVEDTYHTDYKGAPDDERAWTEGGAEWFPGAPYRVCRGGSWDYPAVVCRSARRGWWGPGCRWRLGFRPAAEAR